MVDIVPGQTGAASRATSGPTPNPQADTQPGAAAPVSNSLINQPSASQAVAQSAQSKLNATATNPLTSYQLVPGAENAQLFSFFPNVLDQYASSTYHIRFSMTSESTAAAVQQNGSANFVNIPKIVIAESGATALYNITELTIENLLPGHPKTGNSADLTAEMTIVEPYGITLVDNMFAASCTIGISNYFTTNSYFIELWFTGYNEDGTIATPTMEKNLYKLWQIQLNGLETTTTESGTTYKFKMLPTQMFGHADHVGIVANSINIGPVTTVGAFFDQLANTLTAQNASLYQDKKPRISYVINTPTWMKTWQFSQDPTTSQRNSDIKVLGGSVNKPTISVGRGMDLNTILNFVMSMTKDGQNYTAGEPTASSASGTASSSANLRANGMANLIVIHSRMRLLTPFDTLTNDYPRQVVYTFMKYQTNRLIIDQSNANNTKLPARQQQRQQSLAQSKRYVKRYFWTYTGQNLDVQKFEIKLEWSRQTGVPNNLGYNAYPNFTVGPQYNQRGISNQLLQQYQSAKLTQQAAQQSLDSLSAQQLSSATYQQQAALFTKQLNDATAQLSALQTANPNFNFQQTSANKSQAEVAANNAEQNATNAANTTTARSTQTNIAQNVSGIGATVLRESMYLEDAVGSAATPSALPISARADPSPTNQATTGGSDGPQENASAGSTAANLPASRSLVAAVLYETKQKSLQNIHLEVRGDPFWLGIGNVDEDLAVGDGNNEPPTNTSAAWWYNGDVGFLFTLRTGQSYNEQTGIMDLNDRVLMWNAFYSVIKVKNTFKAGQFTQELNAIRDSLTEAPKPSQIDNSKLTPAQKSAQGKLNATIAAKKVDALL